MCNGFKMLKNLYHRIVQCGIQMWNFRAAVAVEHELKTKVKAQSKFSRIKFLKQLRTSTIGVQSIVRYFHCTLNLEI